MQMAEAKKRPQSGIGAIGTNSDPAGLPPLEFTPRPAGAGVRGFVRGTFGAGRLGGGAGLTRLSAPVADFGFGAGSAFAAGAAFCVGAGAGAAFFGWDFFLSSSSSG